ncbi:MAG: ABC transporter ATP-binding protein [Sulfuricaulis sp.]
MAIVETRAITKRFEAGNAVDAVDLLVKEGEFLVFLGPSGSGKSTLLRMIAGLEAPTSGDVMIGGKVVTQMPPRARNIAMVFQSYALYPHMTVFKNIAFPLEAQGMRRDEVRKKVEWAAGLFDIQRLLERKPRQLSGGERQRVALARAVVREPVVFLLDEPLSNLDAKLRTSARDELQQFQRRLGTTTIYVTHDQVEAMGLGDRIAVLNHGRIHQLGTPQEVYQEPADTFVATFIGSPPMNLVEGETTITGFRPEHFLPREIYSGDSDVTRFPFKVTRTEYLGSDRLVYGTLEPPFPAAHVISRLPSNVSIVVRKDEHHEFVVPHRELRYFNRADGKRTAAAPPPGMTS